MDKSLKTFNLRRSTIKLVRTKQNQSEFVDRAIVKLHNKEQEMYAYEFDTRKLVIALKNREELWPHLRRELEEYLRSIS